MNQWQKVEQILKILYEHNHRAYIVGGAVRDYLLERPVTDFDIATDAKPNQVEAIFTNTHQMNTTHNTIIVRFKGDSFELTTFRGESIEEDLMKRDITINSMALTQTGALIDPLGGKSHLQNRLLTANNPEQMINDDPLRMLRVFRFRSELDFVIDARLTEAIHTLSFLIEKVAVERIAVEWLKIMKGQAAKKAYLELEHTDLPQRLPGMSLTQEMLKRLNKLPTLEQQSDERCWLLFCICCRDWEAKTLHYLAQSNKCIHSVKTSLFYYRWRRTNAWNSLNLYKARLQTAFDVEFAKACLHEEYVTEKEIAEKWAGLKLKERTQLDVSGHDLLRFGRKQGRWISEALQWAEEAVITGEIENTKDKLLEEIERRYVHR